MTTTDDTPLTLMEVRIAFATHGIDLAELDAAIALVPTAQEAEVVAAAVEMLARSHPATLRAIRAGRN